MIKTFNINLEKNYKKFFIGSLAFMAVGLVMFFVLGFNLGIDFQGGTNIEVSFSQVVDNTAIADALKPFNLSADIISVGGDGKGVMIKTVKEVDGDTRRAIFGILKDQFGATGDLSNGVKKISPTIGGESLKSALWSIMIASIGMLIYITLRFEWKFGIAAVVALIHDVLILLTVYVIFRIPVNLPFIAAVLTVVGYSINDTIVVFDRIRDTIKYAKTSNNFKIAEQSIKHTLVRSINTSLTTLLVIGALYVLGVESIKELAFPLLAGVLVGTYSSIFIASPVWIVIKNAFSKQKRKK